jgi:Putative MetA-pathway of phenol degradation
MHHEGRTYSRRRASLAFVETHSKINVVDGNKFLSTRSCCSAISWPPIPWPAAARMSWIQTLRLAALVATSLIGFESFAAAAECTQPSDPIETDRPDVTNSSVVVPAGSLQNENGVDTSRDRGANILSGTNSRWRLGIAPCLEALVDLPNYVTTFRGSGPSGFGDVAPAVKWQLSPLPGKFDLSVTVGAALPTGATGIAGPGVQPYVQIPWSIALGNGWALTGMETNFFTPLLDAKFTYQSTLVIEKEIAERAFLFVEYVGDFPSNGRNSQLINSGGGYRIDDHHQIDFHVGVGLDRNAPAYILGVGYSFRIDGVLRDYLSPTGPKPGFATR